MIFFKNFSLYGTCRYRKYFCLPWVSAHENVEVFPLILWTLASLVDFVFLGYVSAQKCISMQFSLGYLLLS